MRAIESERTMRGRYVPHAEEVVVRDLETIAAAKDVAAQVNALGRFDAVIHNAAVGYQEPYRMTADGLPQLFSVNTLAAYMSIGAEL
jgi:NAD(P)-dependent dehydrogenase (short-subunit alcohol dehydrogenase family)